MRCWATAALAALLPAVVNAVRITDQLQDADLSQSGYLPCHNVDPAKVSSYTRIWQQVFLANEFFLAKPLVYTPAGSSDELVIIVSNQNNIRVLDGATGAVKYQRQVQAPFMAFDSNCGDIQYSIGITGTPYIDPATEVMYFFSKGYKPGKGPGDPNDPGQGAINGVYKMYAVQLPTLADVTGFPVTIDGRFADNDPTRYFLGGTVLQRPSLVSIGNNIVAGFGGHCDYFNYTGMLVSVSKTPGTGVTGIQAMVASPGAPTPQELNYRTEGGGKAGIWQSGGGLAVDGNRVYFCTGNGRGPGENRGTVPKSGKTYLSTLEQAAAAFSVESSGALKQTDWFEMSDFDTYNGGDRDVGSSNIVLLDPNTFNGGGVRRVAVMGSKAGFVYIMDADNLGGFRMGPGGTDAILQTIKLTGSFFGGIASYPLDGGYLYLVATQGPIYAYKFGRDGSGKPFFTQVGKTAQTFAAQAIPVITTLNGAAGTGVLWISDINTGVMAFKAVPVNGVLEPYPFFATGRLTKFQRPAFGNGRLFTSRSQTVIALAPPGPAPSQPPASCSGANPSPPPTPTTTSPTSSRTSTSTSTSTTTRPTTTSTTSTSRTSTTSTSTSRTSTTTTSRTSSTTSTSRSTTTSTSRSSTSTTTSRSSTTTTTRTSSSSTSTSSTSTSSLPPYPAYTKTSIPAGKIVTYNWNITWVSASPDGFRRPFVGINGQWPCPPIKGNIGDEIKINLVNMLGNQTTTLHFHGIFQRNTTFEDGAAMVNQCPIPPGGTFVYQFKLQQPGTYWYHAHVGGQYIDGLRGPLIINDPKAPWTIAGTQYKVDQEYTLTLTDLYHKQAPYLVNYYLSPENTDMNGGAEPVPDTALINEAQGSRFALTPGKTYLFRIINMGVLAGQYLQFDQHEMTIVEVDGVYTLPKRVDQLFLAVAQRYSVIVKAKATASQNFAIVSQFNTDMFGSSVTPVGMNPVGLAYLVYDASKALPSAFTLTPKVWDDATLVPWDKEPLLDGPNVRTISFSADFSVNDAGSTRGSLSSFTYVSQKVPTMFTALSAPLDYVMNPAIYGRVNPRVLTFNSIVEVTLFNHDTRAHPFHLHGHTFQVTNRGEGGELWPALFTTPQYPMKRDTVVVYGGSSVTIRFLADNPGINLFHCHTEWHVESGLTATFIEAPDVLQSYKPYIPNSHKNACDALKIPRKGNAAGNTKNWLDMTGANTDPEDPATYWGAMIKPPPPA
ncbi:Cupredoxin [Apodospora peruviana]|uniref:Cupredoxin n=1 Tax=Apodospora peruviana TaxID=516989 RepID=A0AAE0IHL9_9PEZI|nr:Cupredoxin [Apodospora peruviana]